MSNHRNPIIIPAITAAEDRKFRAAGRRLASLATPHARAVRIPSAKAYRRKGKYGVTD